MEKLLTVGTSLEQSLHYHIIMVSQTRLLLLLLLWSQVLGCGIFAFTDAAFVVWDYHPSFQGRKRITSDRHHQLATAASSSVAAVTSSSSSSQGEESSASVFSGAGPAVVDLNQYNLDDLAEISEQWTAKLVGETALREEGVYLYAKDSEQVLVDTVKVELPRVSGQGLGIELLELTRSDRGDGLGITIVSGLVEGGCADQAGSILKGDSIVKVAVVGKTQEEIFSVATECLDFDKTVEAIGSLPPVGESPETAILTIKRLRRKPKVKVLLQYPPGQGEGDTSVEIFSGENLRQAMLEQGVRLNDPYARRFDTGAATGDCGASGLCATCAVCIMQGEDLLNPAGTKEEQLFQDRPRWRLACKAIVGYGMKEGEMTIRVNPRQWKE